MTIIFIKGVLIMNGKIMCIVNLVLAAVGLAMGVAVTVISTIGTDVAIIDLIRMLGFAAISLGILALNKIEGRNR